MAARGVELGPVLGTPPVNSKAPSVTGTAQRAARLTGTAGIWTRSPTAYAYQWEDCDANGASCTAITSATVRTYTLQVSDEGHTVIFKVSATNTDATVSAGSARTAVVGQLWVVPYVDVRRLDEVLVAFYTVAGNPAGSFVLTDIESSPSSPCTPAWDNGETLAQADADPDLDIQARIAAAQAVGWQVVVSFSGSTAPTMNELSVDCTDPTLLQQAYQTVVSHYELSAIDLDIESDDGIDGATDISTDTVGLNRAAAIYAVQQAQAAAGTPLAVWLTLPVGHAGLDSDAQNVITEMLDAGVKIAGINMMTFPYGTNYLVGQTMEKLDRDHADGRRVRDTGALPEHQRQAKTHARSLRSLAADGRDHQRRRQRGHRVRRADLEHRRGRRAARLRGRQPHGAPVDV